MKIIYKNKNIYYSVKGQGRCILFLHGFTETNRIWDRYISFFSKSHCCIAVDLPGHGISDGLENEHSMDEQAEILSKILVAQNIKNCFLVGHSMGGYVGMAFAEKYQHKLIGLCLFHSSAYGDSSEQKVNRDKTIKIVSERKMTFLNSFIPDLFAQQQKHKYLKEIEFLKKMASSMTSQNLIYSILGMKNRKNRINVLKKITVPVLFIAGKEDKRVPLDKVIKQAAFPMHKDLLILDNVGHMGYIEAENICKDHINLFLKSLNK